MIYFISGHRNLTKENFDRFYAPIIQHALENDHNASFVVGDCEGVDSMAQDFLRDNGAKFVTVYHMHEKPRYIASDNFSKRGGFKDDVSRDAAMTKNSDLDIAIIEKGRWTSGTAQNILRRYEKEL